LTLLRAQNDAVAGDKWPYRVKPLLVRWMREGGFFGECSIVGIRFLTHEARVWCEFLRRLKAEVTTWK
jgi:hypothetical protein